MNNFWETETENCFHMLDYRKLEIKLNSLFETETQKMISKHFYLLFFNVQSIIFFYLN